MDPATLRSLRAMSRCAGVATIPRAQLKALLQERDALAGQVEEHENRKLWFRGQLKMMRKVLRLDGNGPM